MFKNPLFMTKGGEGYFCSIHCKRSIHPLVFTLLKYTLCHIFVSFISRVSFLESLVVKFNVTLDRHNFFIPLYWCCLIHRHHVRLTAVNINDRNIPLQIQSCHVVGEKMMGYPFALCTILTIDGIIS